MDLKSHPPIRTLKGGMYYFVVSASRFVLMVQLMRTIS